MKHIVLVDDSCKSLRWIFYRISEMIFSYYKTHENDDSEKFKITWVHVLNEEQPLEDSFDSNDITQDINQIRQVFFRNGRMQNFPTIEFQCVELELSSENIAADVWEKANTIQNQIEQVIEGNTGFVLLIDIIIYDGNDMQLEAEGSEIISGELFSRYSMNAIPYSNYNNATNEAKFRRSWKKRKNVEKIFDKNELCDSYYNDLYLELFYSKLGLYG